MIGRVKGCLNKYCSEYHKRHYKASDMCCAKCNEKLYFVCKQPKCFKKLPDDCEDKYCVVHLAERADKRESRAKKVATVGGGLLTAGATIVGIITNKKK